MRHFTDSSRPRPNLLRSQSPPEKEGENDAAAAMGINNNNQQQEEEEEEEDYTTMTFPDNTTTTTASSSAPETSLQRTRRLRREALERGRVPSKAELAARERARREEGLARSLMSGRAAGKTTSSSSSKGLAMMAKMGFKPGDALGNSSNGGAGMVEPLRIEVREDKGGLGLVDERKRKMTMMMAARGEAADGAGEKRVKVVDDAGDYRERMAREREAVRLEKVVGAAQGIAERMDEDRRLRGGGMPAARPLKAVPVLWRGVVRAREARERDRRMRHDLEQSGGSGRGLSAYDEDEDEDDRRALGREEVVTADDLDDDDDDAELERFEALGPAERLARLVEYLRREFRYCFWCKFTYPDEGMEGCPGTTEEDHD